MKTLIKKGDKFTVRESSKGNAYYGQVLTVTGTVNAESPDGIISVRLEKKVHNRRNITPRVWWIEDTCKRVGSLNKRIYKVEVTVADGYDPDNDGRGGLADIIREGLYKREYNYLHDVKILD